MLAPVLLDADAIVLTVHWVPAAGEGTQYEVQMKQDDDSSEWQTLSATLQSTVVRKKNLQPNTAYLFRVRSKRQADGEWEPFSQTSSPLRTLPAETARIQEPPCRSEAAADAITVTWKAVDGCSAYELQLAEAADGQELQWMTLSSSIKAPVAKKKGLKAGTRYRFRVRPVFADSSSSNDWALSPPSEPLAVATLSQFMASILPDALVDSKGAAVPSSSLAGKVIAFYGSAHWCGPCRQYTPALAQLYAQAKQEALPFEIVFLSCDATDSDFESYFASMPWLAVPYDTDERESLTARFSVSSIPRLVVLSPAGVVLAQNAVGVTIDKLRGWCRGGNNSTAAAKPSAAAGSKGGCCGGKCC